MLLLLTVMAVLACDQSKATTGVVPPQNPSAGSSSLALSAFTGTWTNVDAKTDSSDPRAAPSSVTQVVVSLDGATVNVHVEGLKPATAKPFAPNVSTKPDAATAALVGQTNERMFILRPAGSGQLILEMYTTFGDSSGRSDYMKVYTLRKR